MNLKQRWKSARKLTVLFLALAASSLVMAGEGQEDLGPTESAKAIVKDCATFSRYSRLKFESLKELFKGSEASIITRELAELRRQEEQFLDRLWWYFDRGLKSKESAEKIRAAQDACKSRKPEEMIEAIKTTPYSEAHGIPCHLLKAEESEPLSQVYKAHIPESERVAEATPVTAVAATP